MTGRVFTRKGIGIGAIAVAFAAGVIVTIVVVNVRSPHDRIPSKQVSLAELPRLDAIVTMPNHATRSDLAHVRDVFDRTAAVKRFARLQPATLALALSYSGSPGAKDLRTRVCKERSTQSYAVELEHTVPDALRQLMGATKSIATVQSNGKQNFDMEVFMQLKATHAQAGTVRDELASDADVVSYRYIDHRDAYHEFKKLFADQPALIENETPAGLPESFRIEVTDGTSLKSLERRLRTLPGVNQVNTPAYNFWRQAALTQVPLSEICAPSF